MLYKLNEVRALIRESIFRAEGYRVAHGIVWVPADSRLDLSLPVESRLDLRVKGAQVLFDPDEVWLTENFENIKRLKIQIGQAVKQKLSLYERDKIRENLDRAKKQREVVGKVGIINNVYTGATTSVLFEGDDAIHVFKNRLLWVATDQDPNVDFRPDESLPEDYYAL